MQFRVDIFCVVKVVKVKMVKMNLDSVILLTIYKIYYFIYSGGF